MTQSELLVEVVDGVATITLNRPHRRNALTKTMFGSWAQSLRELEADPAVQVVVVTGAGGAFSSGVDLPLLAEANFDPWQSHELMTRTVHEVIWAVEALTKPYIAVVSGPAIGAGMDMTLMADYRIASSTASFAEAYIRVGLVPGDGGAWYLPRLIGRSRALRLLWTGEVIAADVALDWGVVDEVVDDDRLAERVAAFTGTLAAAPAEAVALIKRAIRQSEHGELRGALDLIAAQQGVVMATPRSRASLEAISAAHPQRGTPSRG